MPLRFDETTTILMDKCDFLSNTKSKENFVYLLRRHLQVKGHNVQYANADADVEIVKCVISKLAFDNVLVTADPDSYNTLLYVWLKKKSRSEKKKSLVLVTWSTCNI